AGQGEDDVVIAGYQVGEGVRACAVGLYHISVDRRGVGIIDQRSAAIVQGDGDIRDANLAAVLNTIAVDIIPDEVADGGAGGHACVHTVVSLVSDEGVSASASGGLVGIAVGRVGGSCHILPGEGVGGIGQDELNLIDAGEETREAVRA